MKWKNLIKVDKDWMETASLKPANKKPAVRVARWFKSNFGGGSFCNMVKNSEKSFEMTLRSQIS